MPLKELFKREEMKTLAAGAALFHIPLSIVIEGGGRGQILSKGEER